MDNKYWGMILLASFVVIIAVGSYIINKVRGK